MAQQHMVNMTTIGGPVGQIGQPANQQGPTTWTTEQQVKKLNTAIYEYMIFHEKYDLARTIKNELSLDTTDIKRSPKNQANGINGDVDLDTKDHVKPRPDDLPAPDLGISQGEHPFLQDWWCSFWDVFKGLRNQGSSKQSMLTYLSTQRQAQKSRQSVMGATMDLNGMNGMRPSFAGGMPGNMTGDMRINAMRAATQMKPGMQPGRPGMPAQSQGTPMQASGMERQGSAMNLNDARNSGSPNTGDNAPSPKRLRTEGSMTQLNQAARQGQPSNNQVMPQNPGAMGGPAAAQQNAMGQPTIESGDFYGGNRIPPANGNAPGQQGPAPNGNHALQDYQMQLMLLEQQNKKRLLMARQEQDNHNVPSGGMAGADPSVMMNNPNLNPAMRNMIGPAGNSQMRPPPSSHPQMEQIHMMQRAGGQVMPNGFQPGQPLPGQVMPGQQPGQPPNMTPRQGNMAPPPAPGGVNASATNPSSPAQPPAPPTPGQGKNAKNTKKDAKSNKPAAGKKGTNAATNEAAEAPPTPTPPPPVTPNHANSFNPKNGSVSNGQSAAPVQPSQNVNNGLNNGQAQGMQATSDFNMPFGDLGSADLGGMDFADLNTGDVLDNFDFDSFLNNEPTAGGDFPFDANLAFGDPSGIETDIQ